MSSAWSQLEQMLTCAICLDKFKNPRLLPCQHSFCGDACMDGLVDYARRQIKCPECRAEHRIPYQGVQSLPLNVTLIRFLELHARITGEEPEPVPTFMEKCSICGEKIEGVQRCAHCDKKVCPECKEAHLDLLRREIGRINGQTKRSLNKLHEFKETLVKAEVKLSSNFKSVKVEIEDSCRRLISDLELKQRRLLDEVDSYVEQERKTIDKLKTAIVDECKIIESNLELADEKLISSKYQWNDFELTETKDIYNRTMEFVRLFDPEIGDYNRKVRFILIPEFESLRRRLCELGELKFSESALALIANSFQYCNATGQLAQELSQAAASQQLQNNQQQQQQSSIAYGLAHSNSNSNLGQNQFGLASQLSSGGGGGSSAAAGQMLELPNALMRSQSDHRLASQFQARLKQQEAAAAGKNGAGSGGTMASSRYGAVSSTGRPDYESRYAPTRTNVGAGKDYGSELLRDWPRPSDNDSELSFGSSIQFKSAFMRRKEKERQQHYGGLSASSSHYGGGGAGDDDDDLTSEASYGGGRNVRFYDQQLPDQQQQAQKQMPKVFDCREVEHAPLSGVPKLDECPQLQTRLHQLGAKAVVEKKLAEEEGKRDKDLVESARRAMSRASERLRQPSEDEIERQKKANKQQSQSNPADEVVRSGHVVEEPAQQSATNSSREDPEQTTTTARSTEIRDSADQQAGSTSQAPGSASSGSPATPSSASAMPGGRRSLYGQAVTDRSRRQLSSAIQDAADYSARRRSMATSRDDTTDPASEIPSAATEPAPSPAPADTSTATSQPKRRFTRSGSSRGSQQSIDGSAPATPTARRRKTLTRGDSSSLQPQQSSVDPASSTGSGQGATQGAQQSQATASSGSKNSLAGSGAGGGDGGASSDSARAGQARSSQIKSGARQASERQTTASTTTDEDDDDDDEEDDELSVAERLVKNTGTIRRAKLAHGQRGSSSNSSSQRTKYSKDNDDDGDEDDGGGDDGVDDDDDEDEESSASVRSKQRSAGEDTATSSRRNSGNRRSREFLPTYVNKLLDRSAQIRRDSQEQRSRGDSPQRSSAPTSESGRNQRRTSPGFSRTPVSGYSSSPGTGSALRQRLAYQRSQQNDDETTNSNQSIYTTASSQRRSSEDEPISSSAAASSTTRRPSTGGSSTDRTVISAGSTSRRAELDDYTTSSSLSRRAGGDLAGTTSRYSASSRRDSSGDGSSTGGLFQSRFLARSRTSAALSSGSTGNGSQNDSSSRDLDTHQDYTGGSSAARAYLSSRDRFMQSAGSSASSGTSPATTSSASATSSPYTTSRASATNSGSAGVRTHSEYLRNKFARRRSSNSSNSSASLLLSRSRSSHAFASGDHSTGRSHTLDLSDADDDEREQSFVNDDANDATSSSSSPLSSNYVPNQVVKSPIYSPKGRMLFKLGSRGNDAGNFTWPRGVTIGQISSTRAGHHEIVVADSSNHRVQVFDSRGKFISEFGSYGSAPGEFDCLAGVALNRISRQYVVSDRYNHRIQIFDLSGRFVRAFGEFGRDQAKFNLPWGVACDQTGSIYVCDKENHRVQVFDSQGTYLSRFGVQGAQPGQLQHPHYIAISHLSRVVVTDTNNHRVQVFDTSGRLIKVIGREGSSQGEFKFPRGVAVDEQGFIVVGDSGNNRLQVFTAEGQFVKAIGTWGSAEGEFKGIEGVAVDSTNGNIYVCDRENHRIQVF